MRRNVVWNCNGVMVKGNNHTIEYNTIFNTDPLNFESDGQPRDLALYSWETFGTCECRDPFCTALSETCCVDGDWNTFENRHSIVTNNGLEGLVGSVGGTAAVPSTSDVDAMFSVARSENNSAGGLFEQLRDPANHDFRPRPGSVWAQRGIGAYEDVPHGGYYWIPGRQDWRASEPVPPNNATGVKLDADLMWLEATGAAAHRVHAAAGHDVDDATLDAAVVDTLLTGANVVTPSTGLLVFGARVSWRVDVQTTEGLWHAGPVWRFTVADASPPPSPPAPPPPACLTLNTSDAPQPLVYGDMGWQYIDPVAPGYPDELMVLNFTVCAGAWHTGGLGNALNLRLKEFGSSTVAKFFWFSGGEATNLSACWSDGAGDPFPADATLAPFDGHVWTPYQPLQPILDAGVGGATPIKVGLGAAYGGEDNGHGALLWFSLTLCYALHPSPNPPMSPPLQVTDRPG